MNTESRCERRITAFAHVPCSSARRLCMGGGVVSPKEIKRLYKRFQKLDKAGTGLVTSADFMSIPELAMNPLVSRIITLFDTKGEGYLNFEQFLQTLSVFSNGGDPKEKLKCTLCELAGARWTAR